MNTKLFQLFSKMLLLQLCLIFTAAAQINKEETFSVNPGDLLVVSLSQGGIEITTPKEGEVKVFAENILEEEIELLTMEKQDGRIEIKFEGEDSDDFELKMQIPASLNIDLSTGGGNINVSGDIDGKVDVTTGGGNLNFQTIGGIADLSTGGGNVITGDILGDADISTGGGEVDIGIINGILDLNTGGGNINVKSINNSADISTGGGNITIGNVGGKADVSTGGGNVKIGSVSGIADISTGGGNINLEGAEGKVDASTGAGNITLRNIRGSIDASTGAGDIYAELIPDGKTDSDLTTGIGEIELHIPGSANATIVASTTVYMWSGDESDLDNIRSDFEPSDIQRNRENKTIEVTYILNGGGSNIDVSTGMGEIDIRKK